MLADGFDDAIIGLMHNTEPPRVVYDIDKMVEILCAEMTEEEAREYLDYNVLSTWVGEGTPVYVHRTNKEDILYILSP